MERLIQILLLSPPGVTAGPLAAGVEGLVLGLDEAGTLVDRETGWEPAGRGQFFGPRWPIRRGLNVKQR